MVNPRFPPLSDTTIDPTITATAAQANAAGQKRAFSLWANGEFSFKDVLDVINPLQHIPVIGSIYRYLTGDEPSGGTRIIGDGLYGGPISLGVSAAIQAITSLLPGADGRDVGERILAEVFGPPERGPYSRPAVAKNQPDAAEQAKLIATGPPISLLAGTPMAAAIAAAEPVNAQSPVRAQSPVNAQLATALYRSPDAPTMPAPSVAKSETKPTAPIVAAAPTPAPTAVRSFPIQIPKTGPSAQPLAEKAPASGPIPTNRPVPLELSSNLLQIQPRPAAPARPPAPANPALSLTQTSPPTSTPPNPIAQKMLDALDKYERMKKKQFQLDRGDQGSTSAVDISL